MEASRTKTSKPNVVFEGSRGHHNAVLNFMQNPLEFATGALFLQLDRVPLLLSSLQPLHEHTALAMQHGELVQQLTHVVVTRCASELVLNALSLVINGCDLLAQPLNGGSDVADCATEVQPHSSAIRRRKPMDRWMIGGGVGLGERLFHQ